MAFCVNIRSKEFKSTAKRLDISEGQLEQIAHEYMNSPETENQFPSDEYIIKKVSGTSEMNPTKDQITVWNSRYAVPQRFTDGASLELAKRAALQFFDKSSIGVRTTQDGSYIMSVAKPGGTKAQDVKTNSIYLQKSMSPQRQRNLDVLKRFYAGAVSNIVNERRALAEQKRKEYGNTVISRSDLDTNGVLQRREAQSLLDRFRAKYGSITDSYLYTLPNGDIKLVVKPLSKDILTRRALSVLDTMSDQDIASEVQRLEQEYGNGEESLYHINPKKLSEIREQIYKKNPIYDEQTVEESLHYLEGLENEQEQNLFVKTAIGWIKNGTAIFPRDAEKVQQIFSAARKLGIDVQRSKSPIDLQLKVFEKKGNEYVAGTSIVPDQYSELSYNRTVVKEDGTRIDIYDVENTGRGQRAVTDILAKASPKINGEPAASPWCLSTFNYNKETGVATPTESAEHFWNHYNAGKRQIAFVNGKPVAFNSSSQAIEESWWDFNDITPYGDIKNIDLTAPQKLYSNLRDRVAHQAPQRIKSGIYTYTIFRGTDISCIDADLGIENDDAYVRTTYNGTQKSVFVNCIDLELPISGSTRFDTVTGFSLYINNERSGSINVFLDSFSLYAFSAKVSYDGYNYLMNKYRKIVDPLIAQFQTDIKNLIKEIPDNVDINNLEHIAIIRRVTEEALKKKERLQVDIENLSEEFKKAEEEAQKKYPIFSAKASSLEAPTQTETLARELTNAANSHIEDEILSDSWAPLRTAPTNLVEHEYFSAEDADYATERGEKEARKLRKLSGKKYSIDTILKALNFLKEKSYADAYNKRVVKPLNEALASKLHDLLRSWDFEVVFDSLTEVFGQDVLGALDVLEKVVYLSNNGDRNQITDAEEFSHAFIKLMGATYRKPQTRKKHPENKLYSELRDLIVETDLYKQTYDQYSTDPNYLYKNGEVNKAKIAEEALGKALAVALNERYEAKDAAEKSFLEKVKQWFQKILTWFKSAVNKNGRLEKELNNIADSILNGTYEGRYLPKIPTNQNLVTWESTLEADAREGGHGADIIELFDRHGGIITGSLSYRLQGTVYRTEQDTLHDLDFAFDMSNTLFAAHPELRNNISVRGLDNAEIVRMVQENETIQSLSNIPNIHFLHAFPVTKFDGTSQIVVTFMRTENQELADRFKELHGSYKDRLTNFTEEERNQIYLIDCFLENSPIDSSVQSLAMNGGEGEFNVANYKESFKAKLKMGRAKDLIDYRLWKPNRRNIRSADTVRREQDITEELAWQKAPENTVQNQERQNAFVSSAEFYSGAAQGSDSVWAQEARDLRIKVTEYTQDEWNKLSQEQKTKYSLEYESVAKDLARPVIPAEGMGGVLVRRDMMQADSADAIFAIGTPVKPGEKGAKYINKADHEVIDGGTGYAVQRGIQRGIPVYVFDQNNNQWKVWDANTQSFVETQEPKLTPHAATIGTREINENGRLAISRILNNTLSEAQQQESKDLNNAENNANDVERFANVQESEQTINSEKTILSNEELAYWNSQGVGESPRILSASERTDPAFHVKEILDILNGNKTVPEWGVVNGKRQVIGEVSGKDFSGLYLITKHDGLPMLELLETKIPKLIHFSITTLGGTAYEPGVMKYNDLLDRIQDYIKQGLDPNSVTIRIDPIVPGVTKFEDIENVVSRASQMGIKRIRFSVMDAYPNTKIAMNKLGYDFDKYYGGKFFAKDQYLNEIADFMLSMSKKYDITLGTCAEAFVKKGISKEGCLSVAAVNQMLGTSIEDRGTENNKSRELCSCYGGKIDALKYNSACASHCIYCYAKHENDKALEYYSEDGTLKNNRFTQSRRALNSTISETQSQEGAKEPSAEGVSEKPRTVAQQLNALLDSELSASDIANEAEKAVNWLSSAITYYMEHPEEAISRLISNVKEGAEAELIDEIKHMTRKQFVERVGIDNLINVYKEDVLTMGESAESQEIWWKINDAQHDLIDLIKDNIRGLIQYRASLFAKNEGFGIQLNDTEDGLSKVVDVNETNPDNPDAEKVKDDDGEHTGNQQDHWQIINNTLDILYNATAKVKQALSECYLLDKDGNRVKDYLGRDEQISQLDATRSIFTWTQGSVSLQDMINKLEAQLENNPWISQILNRLKDKSGNETDFQSQFFKVFDKHFQTYSIILKNEDGKLYSKLVNVSPALDDAFNAITTLYKISRHPMFVSTGRVNKNSLARLTSAKETLDTYEELTAENSADLVSTMSEILSLMGLPMDEMTITRGLAGDNLSTIKDALGHIVDALTAEQNNEKYNPFKFKDKNSISGYTKQLFKPFTSLMDEVGVSSFYQDGNMYQSYVNPSYTTKLFQKFHLPEAEFRQFLKDEFATSEWFVTDTNLSAEELMNPEVWKLPWLQEIVRMTEKERAEAFVHKVQLLYNNGKQNKSYMRNMSAEEYTISVLTEFFSDKDTKKSMVFANYRFPIMSNKKASEFVRMVRFTGDSYMDSILDRTMSIFNQELSRIQTVETRQKIYGKNHPERIKNFDDNGNHFLFLDYLDSYLHGDNKNTELGKLLRAKLDGKTVDEFRLNTLVRKQIADNYNAIAEESIEKFKANGVFEYMKNIEGIGNTDAEIESAIRNFAWNDTFAAMNITELLVTDLAFYANAEDFQKRFAQVHSPGVRGNKDATDYEGKKVSDGKLRTMYIRSFDSLKSNIKANLAEVFDKRKRNSSDEQRLGWEALEDFIMTALDKVDVTDGQAFMSITGRRKLGFIFGDWSKAAEEIYNKIRAGEANLSDLQTAFQPLKPFVYSRLNKPANAGANTPIKTLNVPIQNKNSVYLLVMAEALLEGEETSHPNLLKALMDFMEFTHKKNPLSGIDIIQFDSAVKSGNQGVIELNDLLDAADGYERAYNRLKNLAYFAEEGIYNSTFVHEIPVEDFAQQQEIPEHFRDHEHIWGSQIRAIIPSDLPSEFNGAPVTFSTIVKGEMKELTGEEFRKEWDETTCKIIRNGINQLAEELGIGKEVPRAERNRKISAILQKEILSSPRYGIDLFLSCAVDENGEFRIPLGDPIQAKRIEQLLNSIIKNRINKQEIAGGPLVLATNWGSSRRLHIKFKDKVTGGTLIGYEEYLAQGHTEKEYVEYIKEHQGGIEYFECLAPAWMESLYRDFTDEKGVIDVEALEMLHPDLLKLFGYRIPTEDKYSAAPYKIVGFLPKEAGDAFMAPWEAILFTGEDFDVDKKNIQRKKIDIRKKKTSFGDLVKSLSKVKELDSLELTKEEREEALTAHRNLYKYKADKEKDRFDRAEEKLINKYNSKAEALDDKYTEGSEELEKAKSSLDTWYDTEHRKLEDEYKKALEELEKEEKDTEGEALEGERQRKVQDYVREFIESPYKFKNSNRYSNANERAIFKALKEAYIKESFEAVFPDAESNDGLKNHIFDMEWSVMTHEAIADQIVNPGGFEEQKRVGYKAAAYKTGKYSMDELNRMSIKELKAAYYTPKNIMNFNTQAQFYKQNAIAGQVLGSFAIQKVAHAMLENRHYGVAVATPFTIMGKTYSDVVEIDKTFNDGGVERIGKTLGSLVSASADAVKDPILNLMNINTTTLKVLCAAIRTGMEFESIAMLLASNTITDVLNTYTARNLSEYVSFDDIIQERLTVLEQNSGIDERSKIQQEELEYEEILADMLGYDPKIEYKILLAYQRLSNIAKAMEPLTTLTRFNSIVSAVGPQQVDNLMMEHKVENAEESTVMKLVDGKWTEVPATTLFDDIPSLREYYTAYSIADELFGSLDIPTASEQFAGVLANLPGKLKEDVYKDRKRITSLAEFFLSYALVENKVVNTENLDYYINKFPESYLSKNFKDKYPNNPFVQAIQIDTRKTSDGKERLILKIDTVGMEQEEKDKLTAGWLQFYKKEPRYAMALFYYNFFTAGVGFSPKSFMGLIPIQVKEAIPGYIQTYRGLPAMPAELIIDLWVRNNVSDSKLVPYVNKDTFSKFVAKDGVLEVQSDDYYNMAGKPYFKASEDGKTKVYRQIKGEIDSTNLTIKYEEVSILGDDGRYMEFSDTPMTTTEIIKESPIDSGVQDSEITDIELDSSAATKHSERKIANDVYTTIKGETIGFTDNTAAELTFEKQIDEKAEKLGLIEDKDKFNKELEEKC